MTEYQTFAAMMAIAHAELEAKGMAHRELTPAERTEFDETLFQRWHALVDSGEVDREALQPHRGLAQIEEFERDAIAALVEQGVIESVAGGGYRALVAGHDAYELIAADVRNRLGMGSRESSYPPPSTGS